MRLFKRLILASGLLLFFLATFQYFLVPIYDFEEPAPFHGQNWYNPYKNIDRNNWGKYNFQVQSKAWLGLTDGHKNSNERIDSVYNLLGYNYVATSDYQKINTHHSDSSAFIPTYEHGYNPGRIHQVCIGAKRVFWQDFVLWQNRNIKQWVLDNLQESSSLVAIAHPRNDASYSFDDLKYLTNYDLMEVLNNIGCSVPRWDAALSAGNPIWILGNDDAHDVLDPMKVGRRFTMINAESSDKDDVLNALKMGAAFGVKFLTKVDVNLEGLALAHRDVPVLDEVKILGDTLFVSSPNAIRIDFFGQNGKLVHTTNGSEASYILKSRDTYVRTEIHHDRNTILYLNPVVRSTTLGIPKSTTASINWNTTRELRFGYQVVGLMIVYFTLMTMKFPRGKRGKRLFPRFFPAN